MITGLTNVFELCENAAQSCKKLAKKFAQDFKDDKMIYFMLPVPPRRWLILTPPSCSPRCSGSTPLLQHR